jgi:hypothetical protein
MLGRIAERPFGVALGVPLFSSWNVPGDDVQECQPGVVDERQ